MVDPSTPNYQEVQKILLRFERETLAPYELPGNRISMEMYDNLPLPWNMNPPVKDFPQSDYIKHDYDREGVLSNGVDFFGGGSFTTLDEESKGQVVAEQLQRFLIVLIRHIAMQSFEEKEPLHRGSPLTFDRA